jgi:hypothetical protein
LCAKKAGERHAKLDHNDFTGIFLGYTATDQNVKYIDLNTGVVKTSHHATFDKTWFLQPTRPPAAQLLYDMGLKYDDDILEDGVTIQDNIPNVPLPTFLLLKQFNNTPYPPTPLSPPNGLKQFNECPAPPSCQITPLPFWETTIP